MDRRDSDADWPWPVWLRAIPLAIRRAMVARWRAEARIQEREIARWDDDGGAPNPHHHETETP